MTHKGKLNPNYRHGRYCSDNNCIDCGKVIDPRSRRCPKCRQIAQNSFKGKKHSIISKLLIGKSSKLYMESRILREGMKSKATGGYVQIRSHTHPNKNNHNYVMEHILIMSENLGRPLIKGEIIHHIDFCRDNNELSNLWLCDRSSHHQTEVSLHSLVKELLARGIIQFKDGRYTMKETCEAGGGEV